MQTEMQTATKTDAEMPGPLGLWDLLPIVADRGWVVEDPDPRGSWDHTKIRDRNGRCPVCALLHELSGGDVAYDVLANTAVADFLHDTGLYSQAVRDEVDSIMLAADLSDDPNRPRLLTMLGLTA